MGNETPSVTPQQHDEYEWLRGELAAKDTDARAYSDEFLAYYESVDKPSYMALSALLTDESAPDEELTAAVDSMDQWLVQHEYREIHADVYSEKPHEKFKSQMEALGMTDDLLSKFCIAMQARPELYGDPYSNAELIGTANVPSHSTDKLIAQRIARNFKSMKDLVGAYENNNTLMVQQAVDFLTQKAPRFLEVRKESSRMQAARQEVASVQATYDKEVTPYYEAYLDTPVDQLVEEALEVARSTQSTSLSQMGSRLVEYNDELTIAVDRGADQATLEPLVIKVRKACAGIFMTKDALDTRVAQEAKSSPSAGPAPSVRSAPAPAPAAPAAPEVAAEDPSDYAQWAQDGKSFTFIAEAGSEADRTLRIEQLLNKPEEKGLVLTSSNPKLRGDFTFQEGPQGRSWYNTEKQRLVIRAGDVLTKKVEEAPAVAEVPAPAPAPVVLAAAAEAPAQPEKVLATASDLRSAFLEASNAAKVLPKLRADKAALEAKRGKWLTSEKKIDAKLVAVRDDIAKFEGTLGKNLALLKDNVGSPAYLAVVTPEEVQSLARLVQDMEVAPTLAAVPESPASEAVANQPAPTVASATPTDTAPTQGDAVAEASQEVK